MIVFLNGSLGVGKTSISHYLLHCDDGPRNARIEVRNRENASWEKVRSAELQELLLTEFRDGSLMRLVDTSSLTVQEVGDRILIDLKAPASALE